MSKEIACEFRMILYIYFLIFDSKGKMRRNTSDQIPLNVFSIDIEINVTDVKKEERERKRNVCNKN